MSDTPRTDDNTFSTYDGFSTKAPVIRVVRREVCAEIESECEKLRAFANEIMDCWPDGDVDGGFLQEVAIEHGLLAPHEVTEPCNPDGCQCAEYGDFPQICYRRTSILDAASKEPK